MTFALFTRAQALCRVQLRTSQPPFQRALIPYSWHLSFVSLFNEANETLGVQLIVINNKSNPLLPLILFIITYKRFNGKEKKRPFRTASLHPCVPLGYFLQAQSQSAVSHTPSAQHVTCTHAQLGHVAASLSPPNHQEPTISPTTTNKTQCIFFILLFNVLQFN